MNHLALIPLVCFMFLSAHLLIQGGFAISYIIEDLWSGKPDHKTKVVWVAGLVGLLVAMSGLFYTFYMALELFFTWWR